MHPFLDHPGPIALAHQGGGGENVENTWPAFEHAVQLGYRYVDVDVQATSDGVVVAFHDDTLDRLTDLTGPVSALPWSEVRKAKVDGGLEIPRIEDLLGRWPELRFGIEVKSDAAVAPLRDVVTRLGAAHRVCTAAFPDRRVKRLRRALGGACHSQGQIAVGVLRVVSFLPLRFPTRADTSQVPKRFGFVPIADGRFVRAAHRAGLAVIPWTIDDAEDMNRLLEIGVDGINTDRPTVLKQVLIDRGEWHQT